MPSKKQEYIVSLGKVKETKRGLLVKGKKISIVEAHSKGITHPILAVLIRYKNKFLVQKRSKDDPSRPGRLDWSASGHIKYGETVEEAAKRELREELGIKLPEKSKFGRRILNLSSNYHSFFVVRADYDGQRIRPGKELDKKGTHFYSKGELKRMTKDGFTRSFHTYLKRQGIL